MSNVPLPRPGSLGLIQYAGVEMLQYAGEVSAAKDAEIERLRAELLKSLADNAALRERVKLLEDALRHVDDCLSINDYDDYVLLSRFDSDIVSAALEQKP